MFIPVIVGSLRTGRNTPRLAQFLHGSLAGDGVDTQLFDPREMALPILEERLRLLENPPSALVEFGSAIDRADAVVIATPEYNKGYPAALKNLIDALGSEWRRKPIGIATHSVGAFAGTTVLQVLRITMLNLGAVPIPASITVPHIDKAFADDGTPTEPVYEERATRFIDELKWYARALAAARETPSE